MLLDRRRIRRWAKWVALFLAVVFVLSFLLLGVGYGGGAGFNLFDLFGNDDNTTTDSTAGNQAQIDGLLAELAKNPNDVATLQALATAYAGNEDYKSAAKYLEQAITAAPDQAQLYFDAAQVYENSYDYAAAIVVLNKAQAKFPDDPKVYLQLGLAQRSGGNNTAAAMAWQKYLALAPNGDQADTIREALAQLAASATTTSSTAGTTTTAGATTTTAGVTTTTASATSSTAAPTTTTAKP